MLDWIQDLFNASKTSIEINSGIFDKAIENDKWLAAFGYKVNWYMIPEYELVEKGWSIQDLADAIGLKKQSQMSWNDGVGFGYLFKRSKAQIYISSPYEGWIYIINSTQTRLDLVDGIIANYYAFGSYRISGHVAWKQVKDNKVVRHFCDMGNEYINIGVQTEEEVSLDFVDLSNVASDEIDNVLYSDKNINDESIVNYFGETEVIDMCVAWTGIDPTRFDDYPVPSKKMPKMGIGGILIRELNKDY